MGGDSRTVPAAPVLEFRGVSRWYGTGSQAVHALTDVSFDIAPGELVVLAGPSGAGKSTLIHLAAGLDVPSAGTVTFGGTDLSALDDDAMSTVRRRDIGLVFQAFHLVDYLTAEENVALPLRFDGISAADALARARRSLEGVGLAHRRGHRPSELSGGEMQRVAIGRALVIEPRLLLADEPTGNLDSESGRGVLDLLRTIHARGHITIIIATHDPQITTDAPRVLQLRDGAVVSDTRRPVGSIAAE